MSDPFGGRSRKRLWVLLLPLWALCLGFLIFQALGVDPAPFLTGPVPFLAGPVRPLTALAAALAVVTSLLVGLLLASELPPLKRAIRHSRHLEAVYEVIRKAGKSLELQAVLDTITRVTVEVTGVRGCSLKLWDPEAGTMRVRSTAGIERRPADLSIDVAQNLYHRSLMEGNVVAVEEALEQDFPEVDDQTEALICVPLRVETKVLGALCVYGRRGERLSPEMTSLLSILGELVTLSISNASAYENLKRLDQAKSWFLLKASHEIRSPLHTIQSIARTLREGYLGEVPQPQRVLLERLEVRARLLAESVGDLLELAKGKAQLSAPELERIELCALLRESLRFYETKAGEKGLSLQLECSAAEASVYGRRDSLQSIVTNLLSNAVKYTPPGGRIDLRLREEDGSLLLEVSDTGIGIPREEQERLFSEFFRASNARSLSEEGTGLGLAIVKAAVEQLGGSIRVESEPGKGSTFQVLLRRAGA